MIIPYTPFIPWGVILAELSKSVIWVTVPMQKRGAEAPAVRGITSSGLLAESTFLALLRSASSLSSNYVYHLLDSVIRHAFDSLYPPPAALISAPSGEGISAKA